MASRSIPSASKASANPLPVASPSMAAGPGVRWRAKASLRARIRQLVTIKGRKIPSELCKAGSQAAINNSITVTVPAMTAICIGSRTAGAMRSRSSDTATLETSSVSSVANPRASASIAVLLTASKGHKPRSCTMAGLRCQRPSTINSFVATLMMRASGAAQRR